MSLYIRLQNNFWTHRKTARLRALIGDAALWVVPRLWSYAAENQPDGCFQDYSAEEISILLAYQGSSQALLQALLQAGFMDANPLEIHGWDEHNAFHKVFSERAKAAAAVRHGKKNPPIPPLKGDDKRGDEMRGDEASNACSNASRLLQAERPKAAKAAQLTDEQWLDSLSSNGTYKGIDVHREHGKAATWCETNNRKLSRKFFTNWLNRAERPMNANHKTNTPKPPPNAQGKYLDGWADQLAAARAKGKV